MGIPKFFRYIAQRWPLSSQLVNDNIIPEFDNLYLDMNSIVHTCTHGNADNVGNLDEDKVFQDIGNYIEHLFSVISPQKVFFMAIDGVAPRAKMNQQRGRRFRSAKDAEDARKKAASQGLQLDEDPFDTNCITPGTVFMANLTVYLKYFIARKITEDSKWQNCKVILSGHEVPGEGEHKIMRFIRNIRSQEGYSPNTRHCLYGLDADLIMLGLSTHETHFSLLREEVTFGRKIQFQSAELSEKRFNLLHLSLVREYLELELNSGDFKHKPDFERQLDDFILIMFFIGNDFLPELPMLMVNDGAIPVIFDTYKQYLQSSDNAYISTNGEINFFALKNWMQYLKGHQVKKFEEQANVGSWFVDQLSAVTAVSNSDDIVLSLQQHEVFEYIAKFMRRALKKQDFESELEIIEEPKFVSLIAEQTGFNYEGGKLRLLRDQVSTSDALRVLRIYAVAKVYDPSSADEYGKKFTEWKNKYYVRKFGDTYDSEKIHHAAERYLQGLQWVLFYYYRNCPSWSWFYDDHYAPMTTEIISAIGDGYTPKFDEGEPFRPFEQLMSVLPDRSAKLLPPALQHLVLEETSPIIDFYPRNFELDRNGKKADWESVVLIPFIDEKRLLKYVRPIEDNDLTEAEKLRNSRGSELEFFYDPNHYTFYKSPSPQMPNIDACTCVSRVLQFPPQQKFRYGLLEGSLSGVNSLAGFPSLYTVPFKWALESGFGVKIFEMPSRDPSIILSIQPAQERLKIGQKIFINWPYLQEARITSIHPPNGSAIWTRILPKVVETYKQLGVDLGKVEAQIGVKGIQGLTRNQDGSFTKDFEGPEIFVPAQLAVHHVINEDERFRERQAVPLKEQFPIDSNVLLLLAKYYGSPATIKGYGDKNVELEAVVPKYRDPVFGFAYNIVSQEQTQSRWFTCEQVAKSIELPVKQLLILTSRLMITAEQNKKINVALPLRKHGMGLMAEGYSRMGYRQTWEFSERGVALIVAYLSRFRAPLLSILKGHSNVESNTLSDMREWLKKHTESLVFMPTTTEHLSKHSVRLLEQKLRSLPPTHLEKVMIKGVEPGALLAPNDAHHELRSQRFKLGDRVVSALDHGKIPLYSRGIVVGINGGSTASTTLDVLWDYEIAAASTLDGRTETNRGLTVPASSVLNLTKPKLEYTRGRAPIVTRISAKVDTRNTAATKPKQERNTPSAQSKYVPAPVRNDWKKPNAPQSQSHSQVQSQAHGQMPQPYAIPYVPAVPMGFPVQPGGVPVIPVPSAPVSQSDEPQMNAKDETTAHPASSTGNELKDKQQEEGSSSSGSKKSGNKTVSKRPPRNGSDKKQSKPQRSRHTPKDLAKNNRKEPVSKGDVRASDVSEPHSEPKMPDIQPKARDPETARKLLSTLFNKA